MDTLKTYERGLTPSTFFDSWTEELNDLFSSDSIFSVISSLESFLVNLADGQINSFIPPSAYIENPSSVYIGKNVKIEPTAFIKGPCWIGDGAEIRHGAYVRENVFISPKAVIGHCSEVKNSILLQKAQAAHFAYVGDSILGNHVNLGAGVKIANLKLKRENVLVNWRGSKIDSGRRKLGAIMGDRTQVGCNTVLNPGTLTLPDTLIYPLERAEGTCQKIIRSK
ncbi:MAG: UDP-N-acetylglucosamine diphosphorylase [Chlamydiales bacterium]|nr:UDP-N-acetylglucosamine diphosphorylase [Chlamydiales bacterium]